MLTARIDRLQSHEKLILKEASVIGTSFPFVRFLSPFSIFPFLSFFFFHLLRCFYIYFQEILKPIHYLVQHTLDKDSAKPNVKRLNRHNTLMLNRHLLNANRDTTLDDEDELLQTLCQLIDCELIECINEENLTYAFKNAAIRDIVYDLLLFKDKLIIHKAVYVWYERTYESENELAPYYTVIAHHTQQAGNLEKTIAYYSRAAQSAVATGAHREAVKYLEEALRIDLGLGTGVKLIDFRCPCPCVSLKLLF
jgi:predicted ATPase